jgi:hypothetical protein
MMDKKNNSNQKYGEDEITQDQAVNEQAARTLFNQRLHIPRH